MHQNIKIEKSSALNSKYTYWLPPAGFILFTSTTVYMYFCCSIIGSNKFRCPCGTFWLLYMYVVNDFLSRDTCFHN